MWYVKPDLLITLNKACLAGFIFLEGENMNFSYIDEFTSYLKSVKGHSELTRKEYYYDLLTFYEFIYPRFHPGSSMEDFTPDLMTLEDLNKVSKQDVYSYISYLDLVKKNSNRTKYRKISSLRAFYKFLTGVLEACPKNPTEDIDMPKIEKSLPIYLSLEEARHFLETILASKQKDIYKYRDYAMATLFLNCGLRLSELTAINRRDLLKDGRVKVEGKGSKERMIYLNPACLEAIDHYLIYRNQVLADTDALFLSSRKNRISHSATQRAMEKHLKGAGFDTNKYTVHKLRHTAATLMYKYGSGDLRALQEVLGHESVTTTQIYTHVDNEEIRQTTMDNPLGKSLDPEDGQ